MNKSNESKEAKVGVKITLPVSTISYFDQKALNLSKVVTRLLDMYIDNPAMIERKVTPARKSLLFNFDEKRENDVQENPTD